MDRHPTYSIRNGAMTPVAAADFGLTRRGYPPSASRPAQPKPAGTPGQQIKAAVEAARRKDPTIPEGYAATAIAAGKSVDQVKGDLFERIVGAGHVMAKASMVRMLKSRGLTPKGAA